MCVLSYKYKESTHFDFCFVKRVQRITVLIKVYECHPLVIREHCTINSVSLGQPEVQLNNSSLKILKLWQNWCIFRVESIHGYFTISYLKAGTFLQCKKAKMLNFK